MTIVFFDPASLHPGAASAIDREGQALIDAREVGTRDQRALVQVTALTAELHRLFHRSQRERAHRSYQLKQPTPAMKPARILSEAVTSS